MGWGVGVGGCVREEGGGGGCEREACVCVCVCVRAHAHVPAQCVSCMNVVFL